MNNDLLKQTRESQKTTRNIIMRVAGLSVWLGLSGGLVGFVLAKLDKQDATSSAIEFGLIFALFVPVMFMMLITGMFFRGGKRSFSLGIKKRLLHSASN